MSQELFHVSRRSDLAEIRPNKFDSFGRMESSAVFVTTREHLGRWIAFTSELKREVHVYRLLPGDYALEDGRDGASCGDCKIVTNVPLAVEYMYPTL